MHAKKAMHDLEIRCGEAKKAPLSIINQENSEY